MFGSGITRFETNNQRAIEQGAASETAWFRRLTKAFIEPYALSIQAYLDYYNGRAGKPSRSLMYLRMLPAWRKFTIILRITISCGLFLRCATVMIS